MTESTTFQLRIDRDELQRWRERSGGNVSGLIRSAVAEQLAREELMPDTELILEEELRKREEVILAGVQAQAEAWAIAQRRVKIAVEQAARENAGDEFDEVAGATVLRGYLQRLEGDVDQAAVRDAVDTVGEE